MTTPADRLLNILLVEDDEVDVLNVRRAFQKNNIANPLFVASNGIEALEQLRGNMIPRERRIVLLYPERDAVEHRRGAIAPEQSRGDDHLRGQGHSQHRVSRGASVWKICQMRSR